MPLDVASQPKGEYPWTSWSTVESAVNKAWDPENEPHHLVVGATGSGKSYLVANGILKPMCSKDRVLIIDTKGDDKTISQIGKPIHDLPRRTWYTGMQSRKKPMSEWYRLITDDDNDKARYQVAKALTHCIDEGNWVIYLDEAAEVCEPTKPVGLGLGGIVSHGMRKGRSRHVSFINATQAPVWVPRWLVDQSSFVWIGRIRDEERHKRLIQVGGMPKKDLPFLASLQKREWMLAADPIDLFYRTKVELSNAAGKGKERVEVERDRNTVPVENKGTQGARQTVRGRR